MKYLNLFEAFWRRNVSDEDKIDPKEIEEICYELTDGGKFVIEQGEYIENLRQKIGRKLLDIRRMNRSDLSWVAIYVDPDYESGIKFDLDEIKEVVLRIKDYIGENYKFVTFYYGKDNIIDQVEFDENTEDHHHDKHGFILDGLEVFTIWYKK